MENSQLLTEYFLIRLLINTVSMTILVRFVYFNAYKKRESFFTFFLLNFIVFLLVFMLGKTGSFRSLGGAFGLLAAFSLLRFRTRTISMNEMTYLFIVMTIGFVNSVIKVPYTEVIAINVMIIVVVYVLDGNQLVRKLRFKTIDYPSIDNIKPERRDILIKELKEYTGLNIKKIKIEHIDVCKKKVLIKMFYTDSEPFNRENDKTFT